MSLNPPTSTHTHSLHTATTTACVGDRCTYIKKLLTQWSERTPTGVVSRCLRLDGQSGRQRRRTTLHSELETNDNTLAYTYPHAHIQLYKHHSTSRIMEIVNPDDRLSRPPRAPANYSGRGPPTSTHTHSLHTPQHQRHGWAIRVCKAIVKHSEVSQPPTGVVI